MHESRRYTQHADSRCTCCTPPPPPTRRQPPWLNVALSPFRSSALQPGMPGAVVPHTAAAQVPAVPACHRAHYMRRQRAGGDRVGKQRCIALQFGCLYLPALCCRSIIDSNIACRLQCSCTTGPGVHSFEHKHPCRRLWPRYLLAPADQSHHRRCASQPAPLFNCNRAVQEAPPPDRVEEEGPDLRCLDHSFFSAESDRLLCRWADFQCSLVGQGFKNSTISGSPVVCLLVVHWCENTRFQLAKRLLLRAAAACSFNSGSPAPI